jgi:hypothetical protein
MHHAISKGEWAAHDAVVTASGGVSGSAGRSGPVCPQPAQRATSTKIASFFTGIAPKNGQYTNGGRRMAEPVTFLP